jgi:hypothetical protein
MRRALPALRAHTGTRWSSRLGSAHATEPSALRLPAALPYSYASSSFHVVLLLSGIVHPSDAISAAATATRHGESITGKVAAEPCLDYVVQLASHERDYPDALPGYHLVQRSGNRPAYERANAQLRQAKYLTHREAIKLDLLHFADRFSCLGFHDTHQPRHIKDRRDAVVP